MLNLKNKWVRLSAGFAAASVLLWASGIAPQAYNLIQGNGTPATRGSTLNFNNTASVTWACSTVGIVTSCSATAAGGGGSGGGGIVTYSSTGVSLSGTSFAPIGGGGLGALAGSEASVQVGAPSAATISSMFVTISTALGIGNSIAITWRKAGSSQTLTCAIANPALTCSDITHNFTVAQGDLVDIQVVATGTIVATPILTIATAYGVSSGSSLTVENNGTPVTPEPVLNLINGTNTTFVCTDNPGNTSTDCKVNASGGGGGFIQPLTAPVAASFTQLNFSASPATTTQNNNTTPVTSISLLQVDPNNEDNFAVLAKAPIAATFTVTVGMSMASLRNPALSGLIISDGGGGPNLIIFGYQGAANGLSCYTYSSYKNFSGSVFGNYNPQPMPFGPLVWLRVQETASARNYYTSADGVLWMLQFTESNTAHFTTALYGIGASPGGQSGASGVGWYSFVETNP